MVCFTEPLYAAVFSPIYATCPTHLSLLDLMTRTLIWRGEQISELVTAISCGLLLLDVGIPDLKGERRVTLRWGRALAVVTVTSSYTRKTGNSDTGANFNCFYVDNYWPATDRLTGLNPLTPN